MQQTQNTVAAWIIVTDTCVGDFTYALGYEEQDVRSMMLFELDESRTHLLIAPESNREQVETLFDTDDYVVAVHRADGKVNADLIAQLNTPAVRIGA